MAEPVAAVPMHDVTDMNGVTVAVPVSVNRIAEQFPAHVSTDILLGVGDRLVAIPQNVKTIPLLRLVYPRITAVPELFRNGGGVSMEDLLALQPDIVSRGGGKATASPFAAVGIPSVSMGFSSFAQFPRSITLAGEVYGGGAKARAERFNAYFARRLAFIKARTAALPLAQRPSVVHISSFPPLVIDGGGTAIDEWITLAGGRDVASSVHGTHVSITMEQLLKWNPDVLIVETPGGDQGLAANPGASVLAALANTPGWDQLKAVKTGRVYLNPQGLYPWDRFGVEEALQIQWAAKTIHPELFRDFDMRAETCDFYHDFFDYTLSEAELDQMLGPAR
jgi:iron complex transport system substrate-binding protein